MPELSKKISCWVVTEGLAGTENQCLGVAEALGVTPEIKRIELRQPWKSLSPYLGFECAASFSPALRGPWPDLLIASGRKSIAAARYIKRKSGGKTFTVQIQDPRIDPSAFDLVAVPAHDPTRGENVIVTISAPNRITDAKLKDAKEEWRALFEPLKAPRVGVLIGGSSKAYSLTPAITRKLCTQLQTLDARLMITASRRTGAENEAILKDALQDHYFWDGTGENPYFGIMAWADFILVSADSASMLSEACSTGKPAYIISLEPKGGKVHPRIDKMHENLRQSGCLRDFDGRLEPWTPTALRDADLVADEIRKRMNLL